MRFVKRYAFVFLIVDIVFLLLAFLLLSFAKGSFHFSMLGYGLAAAALFVVFYHVTCKLYQYVDKVVLLCVIILASLGLIIQFRIDMQTGFKQLMWMLSGAAIMFIVIAIFKSGAKLEKINFLIMLVTLGLLASAYAFAGVIGGAKNWIEIGSFRFQPSEFAKVTFVLSMAYFFFKERSTKQIIFFAFYVLACTGLLVASTDLGGAMLFALTFLIVFFVATGSLGGVMIGLTTGSAAAVASYYIFDHVKVRVALWVDPWKYYSGKGYQIVQGLIAIASGSLFGMGLTMGSPSSIPAAYTDYVFAVVCEEFGILFGVALIVLYAVFVLRGAIIALNARRRADALIVFGCTSLLSVQCFVIIAGVIKMIPLTGITMPFVSYGGSSMWSAMILVGIIEGIAVKNGKRDEKEIVQTGGEV